MPFLVVEWGSHSQSRGWSQTSSMNLDLDTWGPRDMRLWLILPPPLIPLSTTNLRSESPQLLRCTAPVNEIQEWIASSHGPQGGEATPSGRMVNLDCLANRYPVLMLRLDGNNKSGSLLPLNGK